ncbi:hypothetical protein J40TS1_00450 [Paenibacillus montaniterrae]|uniref:Uncharacterized protein n=1 Tax=Paenibacillus montaniterrae TaxID=429341 RepID=A0A919YP17_9BACL|nr:hypothetical protein [Paenibacillus montaniterrae]GIP14403.1 hypothetical protein J40TS1_00450 [Paenibacillus montaniterrae]
MPRIENLMRCELNPAEPVQELCAVIAAVSAYHPGKETELLKGLQAAIAERLSIIEPKGEGEVDGSLS